MDETRHTRDAGPRPGDVTVNDNEVQDRFELFVDSVPAGVLDYQVQGATYALTHLEIDPDFEGRGMGSQLIIHALEQLRQTEHGVLPYCPFVLSFLQRRPEYLDMVPKAYRSRFDLPAD